MFSKFVSQNLHSEKFNISLTDTRNAPRWPETPPSHFDGNCQPEPACLAVKHRRTSFVFRLATKINLHGQAMEGGGGGEKREKKGRATPLSYDVHGYFHREK